MQNQFILNLSICYLLKFHFSLLTKMPASFRIIYRRNGFSPYSIFTQAGCSFLFLLPANHKDISYHLHHGAPTSLRKRYCNGKPRRSYRHIPATQTAHHTDTNHTLRLSHASFSYSPNIPHL